MKLLIRYNFLIDLDSIHNKLQFDYILTKSFLRRFPYTDGQSFSKYKPLQNVYFWMVSNM